MKIFRSFNLPGDPHCWHLVLEDSDVRLVIEYYPTREAARRASKIVRLCPYLKLRTSK